MSMGWIVLSIIAGALVGASYAYLIRSYLADKHKKPVNPPVNHAVKPPPMDWQATLERIDEELDRQRKQLARIERKVYRDQIGTSGPEENHKQAGELSPWADILRNIR